MSFRQSILISVLFSLGLGTGMFFIVLKLIPSETKDAYAVLTVDASYPDQVIGAMLSPILTEETGGDTYISESTQWVFLDDFGSLEQVPLDKYDERVELFDPRYDGYAEKLRSFFVHDGKRFFFIPLPAESAGTKVKNEWGAWLFSDPWFNNQHFKKIEAGITLSLQNTAGSIPFSIDFFKHEKPLLMYFLLFIVAAAATLILSENPLLVAALLPALGALVFAGSAGLAICAAILALISIFTEPIRELLLSFRYWYTKGRQQNQDCVPAGQHTFMKSLNHLRRPSPIVLFSVLMGILLLGILGFCAVSGIFGSPNKTAGAADGRILVSLGIAACLCSGCILWVFLWAESNRGKTQNHIRFMPVSILIPIHRPTFKRSIIPFAVVSLAAVYIPQMKNGINSSPDPAHIVETLHLIDAAAEYEKHAAFQSSFSFIPLGSPAGNSVEPTAYELNYGRYILGEDGLITDTGNLLHTPVYSYTEHETALIPPFPLENLIAFFNDFGYTYAQDTNRINPVTVMGLVPIVLVPGVYMMALFRIKQTHSKKKRILIYDKRIVA